MPEDEDRGTDSRSIEQILHERDRLDKILKKEFTKKMAILFSDVCGYTQFMDTKGDIAGRAWIQKHHDIVLPLIEKHEGQVLAIMGDGVMAAFPNSLSAVKASVAIQKSLYEYNEATDPIHEIHVTMGINYGEILVDEEHIAGDVVNVASRIETKAGRDEILISKTAYEDVRGSEDVLCRFHGTVAVKGKVEPLKLYRVVWQDEDFGLSEESLVRSQETIAGKRAKAPLKLLQLEITRDKDQLKICAYEQSSGEAITVRHYDEIPVPMQTIGERCREIVETLNRAYRKGRPSREVLIRLREIGQSFSDELFTANVKKKLEDSRTDHLILNLDDQLVHVPWELLHDGKDFLCQRFNMGRIVKTRQRISDIKTRLLDRPLKMLVLADPKGDLKGAYQEGIEIRDFMDRDKDLVNVSLRSDNVTPDFIREKIRNFDIVHFAGHAEYNAAHPGESGLRLANGNITANEITKMAGTSAMPSIIFSNACHSARTEEWIIKERFEDEIFSLANAFILSGVKHYVGTFWEILDEPSRFFALKFYSNLFSAMTVGEAIRTARLELIKQYGEDNIVWASYLLYGDPTFNYLEQSQEIESPEEEPRRLEIHERKADVRAPEETVPLGEKERLKISKGLIGAIVAAVILAFLLLIYPGLLRNDTSEYEQSALTFYATGKYAEARDVCEKLLGKKPKASIAHLVLGNIYFAEEDLNKAESYFQSALDSRQGTNEQKAQALMGLGRIASVRNKTAQALNYYQHAAKSEPGMSQAYMSQAFVLDQQRRYGEARPLFEKAMALSSTDRSIMAAANEALKRIAVNQDKEKQERINVLVQELLKDYKNSNEPGSEPLSDDWSSRPLTLWIMDFTTKGYSLVEGKEQLIASSIMDYLMDKGRVKIVERSVLDKLLEELKLSTTRLVDPNTALSLSKILAARLILSGQTFYSGPETQVALRVIETETGEIKTAVNEVFGSSLPVAVIAERVAGLLTIDIKSLYPLRGKVLEFNEKAIKLNIGKQHGVRIRQQFKAIDMDLILEIKEVQKKNSTAIIKEGNDELQIGIRVEVF